MKRVTVIGGGFAGLAAATALAEAGVRVTVLEARPYLGGRARSYRDETTGTIVDNGQHAMMGCYAETLAFLRRIGATDKLWRQSDLRVEMRDAVTGRAGAIACPRLPGPLHMLGGLLGYRLLGRGDRMRALVGGARLLAMYRSGDPRLSTMTVETLMDHLAQPTAVRRALWLPIAIATLNETPDRAAAAPFAEVLARAFFGGRTDSQFVLSAVGLSELYTGDAKRFVEGRGGAILTHAVVSEIEVERNRVHAVQLRDGERVQCDSCIVAVPPRAAESILPPGAASFGPFELSPIVSTHLWFDRRVLDVPFIGLLGTRTHFLFDSTRENEVSPGGQCVSAVTSADRELAAWDTGRIAEVVEAEICAVFSTAGAARCLRTVVVKEKHATISTTLEAERRRPPITTSIENLFLAGDWVATGLPPTIESATLSGHRAAAAALARNDEEKCDAISAAHHDRHGEMAGQELVARQPALSVRPDAGAAPHL